MRLTVLLISCFFTPFVLAQEEVALLKSRLIQGGFYVGQVEPGTEVTYKKKSVRVSERGRFIVGFGRDASLQQTIFLKGKEGHTEEFKLKLTQREYKIQRIKGVAKKYVSPAEKVLGRIRDEGALVKSARQYDSDLNDFFTGFDRPAEGPVSGVYGSQRYFNGEPRRPHFGLDIAGPEGASVIAPADGVVRMAESDLYFSGGTIIVDHGFGITTSYLHLSKVNVVEGQSVERGETIGAIGATGRVTGAHLDWRANWFDVRLDPALMMQD
ncbi:M23 family metallopeptidase [Endozoicomonas arenosclerae]|uniref:M23 family metallopeptidase n=1 Tax=Endozoicomonas arenosclerae TaxID=1633495 RepID=UPI000784E904|nr:M23 family metallopeptidase [Endozoicomonas arenosclerae]